MLTFLSLDGQGPGLLGVKLMEGLIHHISFAGWPRTGAIFPM